MISTLVAASFSLLVAAGADAAHAQAPAQAAEAPAQRATDREIEEALFRLLEQDPERVVCAYPPQTGTRMPRAVCGSVARWFGARHPDDVAARRAPWQLVDQIKKGRREWQQKQRGG